MAQAVETILSTHECVDQAVVCEDSERNSSNAWSLHAYLTVKPDYPRPTVSELNSHVLAALRCEVRCTFDILDGFHATADGSVDRLSLPAPSRRRPELDVEYAAPQTQAQAIMADIWSEILQIQPIGIHDDYFELGGDSLATVQILSLVEDRLGAEISALRLAESPTIAEIADEVDVRTRPS